MSTVSQIIASLRARRFAAITDSEAILYCDRVQRKILSKYPQLKRYMDGAPASISIVAGTKEYQLPAVTNQIDTVMLGGTQLSWTTEEELARGSSTDFRSATAATPTKFYVTSNDTGLTIGFHPTPVANGTATIYGSIMKPIANLTDYVIASIPTEQVFDEGISYYYRADCQSQDQYTYLTNFMSELADLENWVATLVEGYQDDSKQNSRMQ